jgi:hypothetical protein
LEAVIKLSNYLENKVVSMGLAYLQKTAFTKAALQFQN